MTNRYPLDKVLIFSATQQTYPEHTLLHNSTLDFGEKYTITFAVENNLPLPVIYNQAIREAIAGKYDALILVHDDVWLEHDPLSKLELLFNNFGLVGVAGASKVELTSPALWHLMGGGFGGGNLHGAVAHGLPVRKQMTNFGVYPHRTVMIDGVFMALAKETFEAVRFDETNPAGFHFYDLDYSLTCVNNGIKVGVGDIYLTHASPGLREFTDEWKAGEKWFLEKHAND